MMRRACAIAAALGILLAVSTTAPAAVDSRRFPTVADTSTCYSGLIDLTVVANNIPLNVPARSGYYFVPMVAKVIIYDVTGTATSGTLGVHYGNDAGQTAGSSTNLAVATVNAINGLTPAGLTIGAGATSMLDAGSHLWFVNITTVLTGVTSIHGRVLVTGAWVPAS